MYQELKIPSLLIALPAINDPHFVKSVVLLIQHSKDGAIGYVVNRPLPPSLRDAVFESRYKIPPHIPVWMGGPLAGHQGVVLHNQGRDPTANFSSGTLRVSASEEAIDALIEQVEADMERGGDKEIRRKAYPFRFVIGNASWGPKQLDAEMKAGMWIQKPLDVNLLFATPWQEIWPQAIAEIGVHPLDIKPTTQTYMN
jgi:putative transcriptional regulator